MDAGLGIDGSAGGDIGKGGFKPIDGTIDIGFTTGAPTPGMLGI